MATPVSVLDQAPVVPAVVVALRVVPSKILTVELASAVPEKAMVPSVSKELLAGPFMIGAAGTIVSTVKVRSAGLWSSLPA